MTFMYTRGSYEPWFLDSSLGPSNQHVGFLYVTDSEDKKGTSGFVLPCLSHPGQSTID